ncbi:glutaminyl-peptide cyclotransferase [Bacteroidota bacterium]
MRPANIVRLSIFRFFLLITLLQVLVSGCGNTIQPNTTKNIRKNSAGPAGIYGTRVLSPTENQNFTLGETILAKLERISDTLPEIDSVVFYCDGTRLHACIGEPYEYSYASGDLKVGTRPLRITTWYADGRKEYHNLNIVLMSDIIPGNLPYRIENTWPHDAGAYTQGLVYEDGYLYEGTGQWRESSLRKTEIRTGDAVRMRNLPDDVFGEGITILDNKIYQLTYKSQVGFVYEKESFNRIQKVYYQNKEGWGLTHDGHNLIMSDGTHRIYYMDPEYFTELKQIEVYNDKGPMSRLNELEYIDGRIFANIYGEEKIVIIDPESGRVTGILNMKGILPEGDRHSRIDVFNGIAWNPEQRVLYVTGKYWPKLFEISLQGEF